MRIHTGKSERKPGRLLLENAEDQDNVAVVFANQAGGLTLSVSEVHPMDSYNETFECTLYLTDKQAVELRDYLNAEFPK